jgi:hypothetical protein
MRRSGNIGSAIVNSSAKLQQTENLQHIINMHVSCSRNSPQPVSFADVLIRQQGGSIYYSTQNPFYKNRENKTLSYCIFGVTIVSAGNITRVLP